MLRRIAASVALAAAVLTASVAVAPPVYAWQATGWGDCAGWHITNPAESWNSPDYEMGVFPTGAVVPYGQTITLPLWPGEAERTFWLAWRLVGDGDNWIESRHIDLTRDLAACGEATTTTIQESPDTTEGDGSSTSPTPTITTPSTGEGQSTTTTTQPPPSTTSTSVTASSSPPASTSSAPTTTTTSSTSSSDSTLPATGLDNPSLPASMALILVAGGASLAWISRNRETQ